MNRLQGLKRSEVINLLKSMPEGTYSQKDMVIMVSCMNTKKRPFDCPSCVKMGDVWLHQPMGHYFVVLSVKKSIATSAMLTSVKRGKKKCFVIEKGRSRFWKSDITMTLTKSPVKEVSRHFQGVWGNNSQLTKVKKLLNLC